MNAPQARKQAQERLGVKAIWKPRERVSSAPREEIDPFEGPGAKREDFEVSGPKAPKGEVGLTGKSPRKKPADFNKLQREWFEKHGWTFAKCEHKSAYDGRKHDLWTFGDWLAIRGEETLIVQTCAHSSASTRANKAKATPELWLWLAGINRRFEVHGWRQPGGKGTRWEVVIREVTLEEKAGTLKAKDCASLL